MFDSMAKKLQTGGPFFTVTFEPEKSFRYYDRIF